MNDKNRVRIEAGGRCVKWRVDHQAGMPPPSMLNIKFDALEMAYNELMALSGTQVATKGIASSEVAEKGGDRETLRDRVSDISDHAKAMNPDFPGIEERYPYRRNMSDAELLATARAFAINAVEDLTKFTDFDFPATFITDLTAAADEFQASLGDTSSAQEFGVASTAEINAKVSAMMVLKRTIATMVEFRFRSDIGALAAWRSAAHVEVLTPKKKDPPTPPTP